MSELRVMYIASEASPLAKTGGLGDVAGALPTALSRLGHEVCLVIPAYADIDKTGFSPLDMHGATAWAGQHWPIEAWQKRVDGGCIYLLGTPALFNRPGLYSDYYGDYSDNLQRFSFFCRAAIRLSQVIDFSPQVVHVNDWQTALLPAIVKSGSSEPSPMDNACFVLTIHNLAYQGIFPAEQFFHTGLHDELMSMEAVEFWGNISLLKAGIVFADAINTVSPSYALEIKTPEFGYGMDGVLRRRDDDVLGIVNGADYEVWSPATDPLLPARYWPARLKPKKNCRDKLLQTLGLLAVDKQPVMGMVGRIAYQKGMDIMVPALNALMQQEDIRLVILGAGEHHYEQMVKDLADRYPDKISFITSFSEQWAHLIQGGSDMLLMPSLYEPCGLSQLYALRYGTIPIVHATGGLKDTVEDYNETSGQGTGFKFTEYSVDGLLAAMQRALQLFKTPRAWQAVMRKAMAQDFSWDKSAAQYISLYSRYLK